MEFCTFCTILLFIPPPPYQQLGKRHLKITSSARPFVKVFVHVYASPIGQLASLTVFCSSEHLFCEENDLGSGRTLETNNIKISFLRLILLKTLRRWSSVKQQHQNTKQTFAQKNPSSTYEKHVSKMLTNQGDGVPSFSGIFKQLAALR